ncbi:MAG: VOC family protein [Sandaracinaceae bacterium]|nr:MAG: lactoylglutathione lyase [Sandaracinaceae bacterium]HBQ20059.1 lactoylglutathione lyase [Myxococcales bacterium]
MPAPPKRPGPVHHVAVCVRDVPAALAFYRDVLGLEELRRWLRDDGTLRSVWLAMGALHGERAFLAVEEVPGGAPRHDSAPGLHCLALQIASRDREHWRGRLEAAGHPVERESEFTLYARDPEGTLVALSHYPDSAMGISSSR